MKITLNKSQRLYLEAYGALWGYDGKWAAEQMITEGILRGISRDTLDKTQKSLRMAKELTNTADRE